MSFASLSDKRGSQLATQLVVLFGLSPLLAAVQTTTSVPSMVETPGNDPIAQTLVATTIPAPGHAQYGSVSDCRPRMFVAGVPALCGDQPFFVKASGVLPNTCAILLYSTHPFHAPFSSQGVGVHRAIRRTGLQYATSSGGLPPCSGIVAFDFNALIRSGVDRDLVPGATVFCQYACQRAPGSCDVRVSVTDTIRFEIER